MRRLTKALEPQVLVEHGADLTQAYLDSGQTTRPWTHPTIKGALVQETNEKCAYCEGKILSVSFGDIEHILPKSKFPHLVVDWMNLTLACSRCNQHKGSKYDSEYEFINPYTDQIEEHLLFLGPLIYDISDRGTYAVNELGLNEPSRIESRQRVIQNLEGLIRRWEAASDGYIKKQLDSLIGVLALSGEYTAAVSSYLKGRMPQN